MSNRPVKNRIQTQLLLLLFLFVSAQVSALHGIPSSAVAKITSSAKALAEEEIKALANLTKTTGGTKKVGQELGKLNLPNEVLEDTFLRIAIYRGTVTRAEAEGMFSRLSNVPGFRTTLRKAIGNSEAGTVGHLNELRIADAASTYRFKVLGIGEKFSDGLKKADTDIDIVLQKEGKTIAIEAKDYAPNAKLSLDNYRADLDTLVVYRTKSPGEVIPVFSITGKPVDQQYLSQLQREADKRNVQLVFGTPNEQIEQIAMLVSIL